MEALPGAGHLIYRKQSVSRSSFPTLGGLRFPKSVENDPEVSFSIAGLDPGSIANSVGLDTVARLKSTIQKFLNQNGDLPAEERKRLENMVANSADVFHIDTPYKLSLAHPAEFFTNQVYIVSNPQENKKLIDFEEFLKENPFYQSLSNSLLQIVRIYVDSADRDLLQKYRLVPNKEQLNLTTRW